MLPFPLLFLLSLLSSISDASITEHVALGFNTRVNKNERTFALNTKSFLDLISSGIFIDKTLLIDAILHKSARISVITSPTGWGKSTNLDMLRRFFGIQLHGNGTEISPISGTLNYRLFKHGEYMRDNYDVRLEKPFLISTKKYAHLIDEHLGQYPVIYLSFDNISLTDGDPRAVLKEIVVEAFAQHKYMLEVYDRIIVEDRDDLHYLEERSEFSEYFYGEKDDVFFGISYLTKYLHDHFNKKVIIMIDKFNRLLEKEDKEISKFLLHTLIFNRYLERAILTDILPMWLTGFENSNYTVYENMLLRPFYGFTVDEMKLIYNHYRIPEEEQNTIGYWYGGYRHGRYWKRGRKNLSDVVPERFTPRSVCHYMVTRQLKPYLIFSSNAIFKSPIFQYDFLLLILGEVCSIPYQEEGLITERLIASGYLVKLGLLQHYVNGLDDNIRIPNFEIASQLRYSYTRTMGRIFTKKLSTLAKETSPKWDLFILGNECKSQKLEIGMRKCFQFFPKYFNKTYSRISIRGGILETLIYTVVMAIIQSEKLHFVGWHFQQFQKSVTNETTERSEMLLSSKTRGVVIKVRYGDDEDSAINHSSRYTRMLEKYAKFHRWKDIKMVDCKLISNKQVEIGSLLHSIG